MMNSTPICSVCPPRSGSAAEFIVTLQPQVVDDMGLLTDTCPMCAECAADGWYQAIVCIASHHQVITRQGEIEELGECPCCADVMSDGEEEQKDHRGVAGSDPTGEELSDWLDSDDEEEEPEAEAEAETNETMVVDEEEEVPVAAGQSGM